MSSLVKDLGSVTCSVFSAIRRPVCTSANSDMAAGLITLGVLAALFLLVVTSRAARV
ncbi:hypothetical protein [Methylobacterium durans]|uniref:hypothetical protein n=1 Tax=Methylobacterium durans TaxID=2202825 RepID=UPI0013A5986B|nr:hypothetical protein [Methylobacterium durans]